METGQLVTLNIVIVWNKSARTTLSNHMYHPDFV